ncbi:MAG: hypothetical protein ABL962_01100 [Fimbriimonadaceae bacterium]
MSELERKLTRFSRRVRWMTAWKGGAIGGTLGAITSLVVAALDYFRVVLVESSWLVGIVLIGAFVGGILGYFRRINCNMLADSIDRRAMLANRLGTAAEDKDEEMREIQRDDAIAHLSNLKPSEVYPIRVSRWHLGWMVASVLAAGMFILGNSPILRSSQDQADREALKKVAEQIERVAKPLLERKDEVDPETKKLAEQYKRLSEELKKARLPKEEAMQKANELAKEADQLSKQSFQESQQNIARAEDSMKAMAQQKAMAELGLSDADVSKQDLEKFDKMSEEDLKSENQNLKDALSELSKQIQSGKNEKGESLTQEEMEAMKSQLQDLKKQIKGLELSQKIRDFMKELQAMPEFKEIMKLLQELAAKNAQGQKGELKNPELTEKEIEALRKKLEEALKEFEKKIAGMTDADKKKMLEDMKKAIEEALKNGCFG